MTNTAVIMGLALAAVAVVILTKPTEAEPPPDHIFFIPTVGEIATASNIAELGIYYNIIGELFVTNHISQPEYETLYNAYSDRWYELE